MKEHLSEYTNQENMPGYGLAGGRGVTEFDVGNVITFWVLGDRSYEVAHVRTGISSIEEVVFEPTSPENMNAQYHTIIRI